MQTQQEGDEMFDLERRAPVWEALSGLFVDTELSNVRLRDIAQVLMESRYRLEELTDIYKHEVAPVCYNNIFYLTASGSGVDAGWLNEAILDHIRRRSTGGSGWWPFSGVSAKMGVQMTRDDWRQVVDLFRRLHRDPRRLGQTLLQSTDVATLVEVLRDLALLGGRASPAQPAVSRMLEHRDFRVRAAAVDAAAKAGGRAGIEAAIGRLDDTSPSVRSAAIVGLVGLAEACVDPGLSGTDGSVGPTASDRQLAEISRRGLPKICEHLRDAKSSGRMQAARLIGLLGTRAQPATRRLFECFDDRNKAVRVALAEAMVAVAPAPRQALPQLSRALFSKSRQVRHTSAVCLGKLLAAGDRRYCPAVRLVQASLGHESASVRQQAASAIGWMGPAAVAAVPDLVKLVDSARPETRSSALFALGRMDEAALDALPVMVSALHDDNPEVRRSVLRAFQRLGPLVDQLGPAVEQMLADPDWLTQFEAKRTLEAIRPAGPAASPGRPN